VERPRRRKVALGLKQAGEGVEAPCCFGVLGAEYQPLHLKILVDAGRAGSHRRELAPKRVDNGKGPLGWGRLRIDAEKRKSRLSDAIFV
jgi:hypothetical protein